MAAVRDGSDAPCPSPCVTSGWINTGTRQITCACACMWQGPHLDRPDKRQAAASLAVCLCAASSAAAKVMSEHSPCTWWVQGLRPDQDASMTVHSGAVRHCWSTVPQQASTCVSGEGHSQAAHALGPRSMPHCLQAQQGRGRDVVLHGAWVAAAGLPAHTTPFPVICPGRLVDRRRQKLPRKAWCQREGGGPVITMLAHCLPQSSAL